MLSTMQDTLVISYDRQPIRCTSVAQHLCCTFATDMPSKCMISYIHKIIYFGSVRFYDVFNITLEYLGEYRLHIIHPNILLRCEHKYYNFTIEVTLIMLPFIVHHQKTIHVNTDLVKK